MVSDTFVGNAKSMAKLGGIPDYPFIALPHPVSSLSKGEIDSLVERFLPRILGLLVAKSPVEAGKP